MPRGLPAPALFKLGASLRNKPHARTAALATQLPQKVKVGGSASVPDLIVAEQSGITFGLIMNECHSISSGFEECLRSFQLPYSIRTEVLKSASAAPVDGFVDHDSAAVFRVDARASGHEDRVTRRQVMCQTAANLQAYAFARCELAIPDREHIIPIPLWGYKDTAGS